jgi:hypothetical protein
MSCHHPLQAFQHKYLKGQLLFKPGLKHSSYHAPLKVACGQCIGCRLEHSRQWAMRCMHEAHMYEKQGLESSFLTLTYAPEHLPEKSFLERRDFQLFMKRLRKYYSDVKIKVFYCGEYGGKFGRPHFHAIIFGLGFPDKVHYKTVTKKDGTTYPLFTSPVLEKIWGKGYVIVGAVTPESAGYVAQYTLKKKTGEQAKTHYDWVDPNTLEVHRRPSEFSQASLGEAIGKSFYQAYQNDIFPSDEIIVDGMSVRPPKLYMELYALECPKEAAALKDLRALRALEATQKEVDSVHAYDIKRGKVMRDVEDFLTKRLRDKETIVRQRISAGKRLRNE